jgi:ParB family chromosome partitioning protein
MPRRTGLGKGLEALIPGGEGEMPESGITSIAIDRLTPNPRQPRVSIHEEDLTELAASIQEHGIIQPLLVMPGTQPGDYILVAGERRWRAARMVGMEFVPAIVRQVTPQEQLELALIENLQRSDLAPLEIAAAYRQMEEDFKLSHEEIGRKVGKDRSTVANTLRLLKLPQAVLAALAAMRITEGHARAMLALPSVQAQLAVLQTVLNQDLNVRQTEALVRQLSGQRPESLAPRVTAPEVLDIEDRLRRRLGTKVTVHHGKKGGTVTIHYYSNEELEAIVSQILKE